MSAFIKDTKNGAKTFKNASIIGMSIVIGLMFVGAFTLSATISKLQINEWGIVNSYYYVFPAILGVENSSIAGRIIIHFIGFITAVSGFGSMFF